MWSKRGFYLTTLIIALNAVLTWGGKVTIEGVNHVCQNNEGHMGRCTSKEKCRTNNAANDSNANSQDCPNGHGEPPYICCIFGSSIVFPDHEAGRTKTYNNSTPPTLAPKIDIHSKPLDTQSSGFQSRGILFPNEDGHFDIPTPSSSGVMTKMLTSNKKLDLFPKPSVCGPMALGDKIHGGVEAELGEFAWLVNLEYRTQDGSLEIGCGGNILNHRYIVTAGHCVKGLIEELLGPLVSLRVGDHNTQTDLDCDDLGCNAPYERFQIAERYVHEDYRETKKGRLFNDIALLKTDRPITYSFSVAPICLPEVMGPMDPLTTGVRLTVAGWGNNGTSEFTDEKFIVDVPYVESTECPFRVQESQLCAGGETGKDSCTGDSGGSLARRHKTSWVIEGIVSFGRKCGTEKPAIYTRVRNYISWILDKVTEP
uniref:Peptidase S1 domain-containing protein n=1 Tax=Stomoxys calcitrans TaxID=35570 RepID=A0A1I8P524_STOCA